MSDTLWNTFHSPATWVRISGADAKDFLHRLTTADFRNLLPGETAPGFFLTPQGKIRAGFHAACTAKEAYLFRVPTSSAHAWSEHLLTVIDQFTFTEKMTVEKIEPTASLELLGPSSDLPFEIPENLREEGFLTLNWGARAYGKTWISHVSFEKTASKLVFLPLEAEQIDDLRIRALTPNWENEIQPDANPLELGMTDWIAENKGCYPGQEVIEKIISLGSPAKRLCLLRKMSDSAEPNATVPRPVFLKGEEVGILTSERKDFALALLRRNALQSETVSTQKTHEGGWQLVRH